MANAIASIVVKVLTVFIGGEAAATAGTLVYGFLTGATAKALAYVAVSAALSKANATDLSENVDLRRESVIRSAIEPRAIHYGRVVHGGVLTYQNVAGTDNRDMWVAITHAGHEVSDITNVWFDDKSIGSGNISWGSGVTGGDYYIDSTAFVSLYRNLGTSSQTVITDLDTAFADITTASRGRGCAYTVSKLTLTEDSQKIFEAGVPQTFRADMNGKIIYDPDLDAGGVGADPDNASYAAYSTNPIQAVADNMRDTRLGMGIANAKINWQTVSDEAAYCGRKVPTSAGSGATEARFSTNGTLLTSDVHSVNIRKLLSACNGRLSFRNGQWNILAGRYGEGANLCTNGEFDSNITGWTNGIPARGTVAHTSSHGGGMLLTNIGSGFCRATYPITTVVGYTYTFKANNKSDGADTGYLFGASDNADGSSPHTEETGSLEDAVYQIEFVATATTTYIVCMINNTTSGRKIIWDDVEAYLVTSVDIDEDWLRGDIAIQTATPKAERFNSARGFYQSSEEEFKKVQSLEVINTAFISRDDGETLFEDYDLPVTNTEDQAQRLLFKRVKETDEQIVITMPCNYKALDLVVQDRVMVSINELSWVKKVFRVIEWGLVGRDGGIDLTLREDSLDAYEDLDANDYSTRTASGAIALASPSVPDPTNVTLAARTGLPDLLISFVPPTVREFYDTAQVWRHTADVFASATKIWEGRTNHYTDTQTVIGTTYYYWVRMAKGKEVSSEVATTPSNSAAAAISAGTADAVNWSGVVDDGNAPADNSTVGATWGGDINNEPADLEDIDQYATPSNLGFTTGTLTGAQYSSGTTLPSNPEDYPNGAIFLDTSNDSTEGLYRNSNPYPGVGPSAFTRYSVDNSSDRFFGGSLSLDTNNKYLYGETSGGTARTLIGMDSSNRVSIGHVSHENFFLGDLTVDDGVAQITNTAAQQVVYADATNASYNTTVCDIHTTRTGSSTFSLFKGTTGAGGDLQFHARGDGEITADGSFTGGGADYGENFEWLDGNSLGEDRVGYSVVLVGNKIRIATQGEIPLGVISGRPAMVGDGDMNIWKEKYLKDDFGRPFLELYSVLEWVEDIPEIKVNGVVKQKATTKNHSYEMDRIPQNILIPDKVFSKSTDSNGLELTRKIINPLWTPSKIYVPRSDRLEWDIVGLLGKLRMRRGQVTAPTWTKMRDISSEVEEWYIN